jgi:hypothetical protein
MAPLEASFDVRMSILVLFSSYCMINTHTMLLNLPILKNLSNKTIVLASASPRRREILTDMVYKKAKCFFGISPNR